MNHCVICGNELKPGGTGQTCSIRCYKLLHHICQIGHCNRPQLENSSFCAEHQAGFEGEMRQL
jgi:hypothetical protein